MQGLVLVLVVGVGAQWLAWKTRLPAILLLLMAGIGVGPGLKALNPDEVFGRDLVLSFASLAVAIILFEGGMTLKWRDLRQTGAVVPLLATLGVAINWVVGTSAAFLIAGFPFKLALLYGALMTVSGPTVIMPLLRQVRPTKRARNVLKWEAIVADPLGAVLAVLVFDLALINPFPGWQQAILTSLLLLVNGIVTGLAGAGLMVLVLRRFWVPDYLHAPLTLALVVSVFATSNVFFHESGLLAVTVMGIAMANQKFAKVEHILEFKENLRVLLISTLFILLAARLNSDIISHAGSASFLVVLALIFVGRPLCVFASTALSSLNWRERVFLAGVMPRGIVAAAVSTVFALQLEEANLPGASELAAYSILTVIATVFVYGLAARPLARKLEIADEEPQGVLIVGANRVSREVAHGIKELGFRVVVADRNPQLIEECRRSGLEAECADVLEEEVEAEMDLTGVGKLIVMTSNDEINDLVVLQWTPFFGRANVYRVAPISKGNVSAKEAKGRVLLNPELDFRSLSSKVAAGHRFTVRDAIPEGGTGVGFVTGGKLEFVTHGKGVPNQASKRLALVPPGEATV